MNFIVDEEVQELSCLGLLALKRERDLNRSRQFFLQRPPECPSANVLPSLGVENSANGRFEPFLDELVAPEPRDELLQLLHVSPRFRARLAIASILSGRHAELSLLNRLPVLESLESMLKTYRKPFWIESLKTINEYMHLARISSSNIMNCEHICNLFDNVGTRICTNDLEVLQIWTQGFDDARFLRGDIAAVVCEMVFLSSRKNRSRIINLLVKLPRDELISVEGKNRRHLLRYLRACAKKSQWTSYNVKLVVKLWELDTVTQLFASLPKKKNLFPVVISYMELYTPELSLSDFASFMNRAGNQSLYGLLLVLRYRRKHAGRLFTDEDSGAQRLEKHIYDKIMTPKTARDQ